MPKSLLLLACSQKKRIDRGLLPAIERYDGGSYRILNKAKREGYWPENLDVMILSAKYGLIASQTPIEHYEQRMTSALASCLNSQTLRVLEAKLENTIYNEIYIDLGQDYLKALYGVEDVVGTCHLHYAHGRIGERLSSLKKWLIKKHKQGIQE